MVVSAKWHFDFGTTLEANQHSILPRKSLIEEDLRWVTDVGWVGADSADPNPPSPCPPARSPQILRKVVPAQLCQSKPSQARSRPVKTS